MSAPSLYTVDDIERFDALIASLRSEQMSAAQWEAHCADEPGLRRYFNGEMLWVHADSHAAPVGIRRASAEMR